MARRLLVALLSVALTQAVGLATAATTTIEARHEDNSNTWQPQDTAGVVGDTVEWKLHSGTHGLRITNWNDVKSHVEIMMVTGQQPFNATTGRNDNPSSTADQVLLRVKLKSVPPADIKFNCTVHGANMSGKVTVSAAIDN